MFPGFQRRERDRRVPVIRSRNAYRINRRIVQHLVKVLDFPRGGLLSCFLRRGRTAFGVDIAHGNHLAIVERIECAQMRTSLSARTDDRVANGMIVIRRLGFPMRERAS